MKLNKAEVSQVKQLMRDDKWEVLLKYLGIKLDEWDKVSDITGMNEMDMMREMFKRQGKVEGIKEFFDQLERQAFEN